MNRDNAINGLVEIADWEFGKYEQTREEDYLNDGEFLLKVVELLKAQEARLVTYEDFHSGREDGGEAIPCWKEARSKTRRSGWAVIVYGKMLADAETGVARYWTARPTEEQMREEAWSGTK